jgi:enolase
MQEFMIAPLGATKFSEALRMVLDAIGKAGYKAGEQIGICLDPASSEFYEGGKTRFQEVRQ